MTSELLTTYLNNHLAGSVVAIQLVEHLASRSRGSSKEDFFTRLGAEIKEDQEVLMQLLRSLGGKESKPRKAAAWLTEKITEVKLRLDDPGTGQLELLEALEAIGLGLQGKLALWRALAVVADRVPEVARLDLPHLERRAETQHQRVDQQRLDVVRGAFGV